MGGTFLGEWEHNNNNNTTEKAECTDVLDIFLFLQTRQGCLRVIVPTILFSPMLSHPGPAQNHLLSMFGCIRGHASMLLNRVAFSDGDISRWQNDIN